MINPQGRDPIAADSSNGTDFNSTYTSTSLKSNSEPADSLPHPTNTRLFYKISKSGSQDIIPTIGLLLGSYFLATLL